jgi:hypothetical protein
LNGGPSSSVSAVAAAVCGPAGRGDRTSSPWMISATLFGGAFNTST